ncbi:MAG: helix-turn-helix transcriptional regulator [Beijerinckiaceae bacterium]
MIDSHALYTEAEAAALLRVSRSFLAKARLTRDGPRYVKFGRAVRYPGAALIDYQKAGTRHSTSEYIKHPKHNPYDKKADDEGKGRDGGPGSER